ncbi:MAG: hypothetical protein ACJ76S_08790 [Solirubrobacteraceae bacterium]|jgi:hypothetical protein
MSRRLLLGLHGAFWLLVATEVAYVLLWANPPISPGILIVALALCVGLAVVSNS